MGFLRTNKIDMNMQEGSLPNLTSPSEQGVRLDLLIKTQQTILERVLPALHEAIEEVTNFMYEPEADDDEIHDHLRELSTETIVNELVRMLTRDPQPVSRRYMVNDVDGIGIDTLIACYSELAPQSVRAWYAQDLKLTDDDYQRLASLVPAHMAL